MFSHSRRFFYSNSKITLGWCTFCYGNAFWERVEAARKALGENQLYVKALPY
jgi:hypothetical protein